MIVLQRAAQGVGWTAINRITFSPVGLDRAAHQTPVALVYGFVCVIDSGSNLAN